MRRSASIAYSRSRGTRTCYLDRARPDAHDWVQDGEIELEMYGAERETTNNRMEMRALIEAYRALPEDAVTTVFTDSQLCFNTITQWAPAWERKGWKRKGKPLRNLDLVKELLELYRAHPNCPLTWTRAHVGSRWNEYADSLASAWRRSELLGGIGAARVGRGPTRAGGRSPSMHRDLRR